MQVEDARYCPFRDPRLGLFQTLLLCVQYQGGAVSVREWGGRECGGYEMHLIINQILQLGTIALVAIYLVLVKGERQGNCLTTPLSSTS